MARDDRMMVRADARAIGAVTSTTVRASERWRQSENRRASECISYFAPDKSDARIFRAERRISERTVPTTTTRTTRTNAAETYNTLVRIAGTIGDQD